MTSFGIASKAVFWRKCPTTKLYRTSSEQYTEILMDMENNKMGKVDKRLLMSKNSEQSKTNTKTLTKKRGNKQNHQNQFLDED